MPETQARQPEVSVIIATRLGQAHVGRALESLAAQFLSPAAFEILLVVNGPLDATPDIVDEFRLEYPQLHVRMILTEETGASNARNIGLKAAAGEHVTFMDDDDYVSPGYLAALLDAVGPGIVPVAFMSDVPDGGRIDDHRLDNSHYFTAPLLEYAGSVVPAEELPSALSANVGKLVPAAVARRFSYRTNLRSGEDFVFWTELYVHTRFCFRVLNIHSNAVYYRTVRPGSISRQIPSYDFSVTQRLDCIEALNSIKTEHAVTQRVVQGKIVAQVSHLTNYLTRFPERRDELLADIRARQFTWFPYQALNRGAAKDLAMLYCFVPYQDTSALVSARRIRERGVIVDVISNRLDNVRPADDWASEICREYIGTAVVTDTPQAMGSWRSIRSFTEVAVERAEKLVDQKGEYRSVYSRAMWPASHFAAAVYKIRHPDTCWIAEFSDPMLHDITGEVRPDLVEADSLSEELCKAVRAAGFLLPDEMLMWEWVELVAYALADEVVFTNANQRQYMLSYTRCPELAARAHRVSQVSHHPTLPDEFYGRMISEYVLDPGLRHIAYFGAFYPTRGASEVTRALSGLDPHERSKVRFHIFTNSVEETRKHIEDMGLGGVVVVNNYVPFLEFLNLTTRFDVLLVTDAETRQHHPINPYLPSKFSDYVGSGTPIWAIVEDGSALSSVPTHYRSCIGEVGQAHAILRTIADETVPQATRSRGEKELHVTQHENAVAVATVRATRGWACPRES
jgi:glycosyltransferase involved in cell wall biosynthesis